MQKAVFTAIISMIGSEYYNSIVVLPFILQNLYQSAKQPVFIAAISLEMPDRLLVLIHRQLCEPIPGPSVKIGFIQHIVIEIFRKLDVIYAIQVQKSLGDKIRIMRPYGSTVQNKGLIGVLAAFLELLFCCSNNLFIIGGFL